MTNSLAIPLSGQPVYVNGAPPWGDDDFGLSQGWDSPIPDVVPKPPRPADIESEIGSCLVNLRLDPDPGEPIRRAAAAIIKLGGQHDDIGALSDRLNVGASYIGKRPSRDKIQQWIVQGVQEVGGYRIPGIPENKALPYTPPRIRQDASTPLREEAPPEPQRNLIMLAADFIKGFVPPDYVIDGLLRRGYLYSLTAMTGGGKTAIALLLAAIASNRKERRKLGAREVEHVRVIYIACENAIDVQMRLIGMEAFYHFDCADLDLLVIDEVFDLGANIDRIRQEAQAFGGDIGLVFIDTSAAMFQGDEENNNMQALDHAKLQRRLCVELPGRPCVVALTHPTKSVSSPQHLLPRGGGAYLNEVDGNFTAWAHDERMTTFHWTGKLRGPDFDPIEFRLPIVNTTKLTDSKGRIMPTVVAEIATAEQVEETEQKAAFQERRLLEAMAASPGASVADLARACGWHPEGHPEQPYKSMVDRVMKRLEGQKFVTKDGRTWGLTKKAIVPRNDLGGTTRNDCE